MKLRLFIHHRFSMTIVILLSAIIAVTCLTRPLLGSLSWDVFSYYLYLPATFIYNDLGLHDRSWVDMIIQKYHNTDFFYQAHPSVCGTWVIKTSMGLSYFYAPFFLIGHLIAVLLSYPPDGFSAPYQISLNAGMIIYTFIGLVYLRKILLHYFSDLIAGIVIVLIVLGTNYFNLTAYAGLMPHNILFMLVAMFVWYTIKWSEDHKLRHALFLGIISGLIIISRPNEIVCVVFLLLLGYENLRKNTRTTLKHLMFGAIVFFITIMPQLLYWKMTSGSFIYFSYQDPNEGFDFDLPYIIDFLFSFRKGWLLYTPLVMIMFGGMVVLFKKHKRLFFAVLAYVIFGLYIASSWSNWWYGGCCYSQRAVMSLYVVLALPLGFLLERISGLKWSLKALIAVIFVIIISLNLFQTWQFNHGIINGDRMTKKYYCKVFGATKFNAENLSLLSPESKINEDTVIKDFAKLPKISYGFKEFCSSKNFRAEKYIINNPVNNEPYYLMDSTTEFSPSIDMSYKTFKGEHSWAKASVYLFFPAQNIKNCPFLVITTLHKGENYKYYTHRLPKDSVKFDTWIPIEKLYFTPEIRSRKDKLSVYLWNPDHCTFYIRSLNVDIYDY